MTVYRFLDYELDPEEGTLRRGASTCPLAPKVIATLSVLVENDGRVVSKDRLMEAVWKGTFVEENNLTQYIFLLRRFFQEDHPDREFIKTVPRRGYSFNVPVEFVERDPAASRVDTSAPLDGPRSLIRRRPVWLTLLFLVIALFSASFIYRSFVKPTALDLVGLKIRRLTQSGDLVGAALSPDGNSVVYAARSGEGHVLKLTNIQTDSEVQILGPSKLEINSPRFSPDGNSVFYGLVDPSGASEIFKIPIYGGGPQKIAAGQMSCFSVSPDGTLIAFPRRVPSKGLHQLVLAATDGSGEHVLAERTGQKYYSLWGPAPAWSADGSSMVVAAGGFDSPTEELVNVDAQTGAESPIATTQTWEYIGSVGWYDPDTLVVTASEGRRSNEQIWKIEMPAGKVSRVSNDLASYSGISIDPRIKRVLATQERNNFHLWLWDSVSETSSQLTAGEDHSDGTQGVAIAPDDGILFTARDKGRLNIYETDKNGRPPDQLTENAGNNFEPTVARDGGLIAFVSDRSGQDRIWIANRDGSNARMLRRDAQAADPAERTPNFSPDGAAVYFLSVNAASAQVMQAPLDGSHPPKPVDTPGNEILPAVSPDGSLLSVGRGVGDNASKISVVRLDSPQTDRRFFDFPAYRMLSAWLPDSRSLVTISGGNEGNNLIEHDLVTGADRPLTGFTNERIERFAIAPKGQWFVLARGTASVDAVLFEK